MSFVLNRNIFGGYFVHRISFRGSFSSIGGNTCYHQISRNLKISKSRFQIWKAHRQHRCQRACQIVKRYDDLNTESRSFETSRDVVVRRLCYRLMNTGSGSYWPGGGGCSAVPSFVTGVCVLRSVKAKTIHVYCYSMHTKLIYQEAMLWKYMDANFAITAPADFQGAGTALTTESHIFVASPIRQLGFVRIVHMRLCPIHQYPYFIKIG